MITSINEFKDFTSKQRYKEEYISYHGDTEGFDYKWNNLMNKNFDDGGLVNIPEYVELSRLINIVGELKINKNLHWIRTSDEYLFYDRDWLFLSDVKIDDNTKILRIKTHKSNINIEQTIIQNLTFDYEKEITLKDINLENYEIVKY